MNKAARRAVHLFSDCIMIWELTRTKKERVGDDRRAAQARASSDDLLELLDEEARYYAARETRLPFDERRWQAELESEA